MNKITKFILNHKIIILSIFVVILIASLVCVPFVKKNSDVQEYLPSKELSSIGKEALAEKFNILGEFNMAIKGVDKNYMDNFTAEISKNEAVSQLAWIGRFDALKEAMENASGIQQSIYKDSYQQVLDKFTRQEEESDGTKTTVYIVSIYLNKVNADDATVALIDEIIEKLDNDLVNDDNAKTEYFMGGGAINSRTLLKSSIGEIPKYLIVAVIIISIILLITTKSWLEPLIFLATLGVSILINMGTNLILGTISTITYSASTILQLALAMDYSIFLMHSYYEERSKDPIADAKTCMSRALPKTLKSVAASALTTIGGFIALFTMEFGIGIDLGAVLAKGVFLSLVTVVVLQPVLILLLQKPIEKTQHKHFTPKLKRVQKGAIKARVVLVVLAVALMVPSFIGQFNVPLSYLTMTKEEKNPSATQQIIDASNNQVILMVPDNSANDPKDYVRHYNFLKAVKSKTYIGNDGNKYLYLGVGEKAGNYAFKNIFSAYTIVPEIAYNVGGAIPEELDKQLKETFFKNGYVLYTFELNTPIENDKTYANIDKLYELAGEHFNVSGDTPIMITGLSVAAKDLARITPTDFLKVSLISALIIFVILLLTYKSFSLSAILLLVIELGIWINLSIVTLSNIKINFMSYLIISSIQLGATVDYAILVASKYKQVKNDGETDDIKAIVDAIKLASPSVMVSASVLICACLSVLMVTTNTIIAEITTLIAMGAAMSTVLVMTLLPAVLAIKSNIHNKFVKKKLAKAGVEQNIVLAQGVEVAVSQESEEEDLKDSSDIN